MARSDTPRPPDHRWRLAHRLLNGAKAPRPEAMTEAAARVLAGGTNPSPELVEAVRSAIRLYGADDSGPRDDVEAWLLCGLDPARVAAKTGAAAATVRAYRDLFFDVTPWLATDLLREALAWRLLGEKLHVGMPEADLAGWKRFLGLSGGEYVLGPYLEYWKGDPPAAPSALSGLSDADLEHLRHRLACRRLLLSQPVIETPLQARRLEYVFTLAEGQRFDLPPNFRR